MLEVLQSSEVMTQIQSARQAREFISCRIAEQALYENIRLTEFERKWLDFSETDPVREGTDPVDEKYADDDGELDEDKIALLIHHAVKRARRDSPQQHALWWEAIRTLRKYDLYLNVMIDRSGIRPPGDLLKLLGTAFLIVAVVLCVILCSIALLDKLNPDPLSKDTQVFYVWLAAVVAAIAISIDWFVTGGKAVDTLLSKTFFRRSQGEK